MSTTKPQTVLSPVDLPAPPYAINHQFGGVDGVSDIVWVDSFGNRGVTSIIILSGADGTAASPTPTDGSPIGGNPAFKYLGYLSAAGWVPSGRTGITGTLGFYTDELWTDTSTPTYMIGYVTPSGTRTLVQAFEASDESFDTSSVFSVQGTKGLTQNVTISGTTLHFKGGILVAVS